MQFSIREMLWITAACAVLMILSARAGALSQLMLVFGCLAAIAGAWLVSLGITRRDQALIYTPLFLLGCCFLTAGLILGGVGLGAAFNALLVGTDAIV